MFPKKDKNEFSQVYSIEIITFDLLVSRQPFNKKKNSTHENLQGHKMLSVRSHHRRWYLWSGHDLRDEEDLSLTLAAEKKPSSSRVMRHTSFDWMDTLLQFEKVPQIHYRRYSVITSPIRFWIGSGSGPSPPPEGTAKRGPGGPGKPGRPATPGSPFSPEPPPGP